MQQRFAEKSSKINIKLMADFRKLESAFYFMGFKKNKTKHLLFSAYQNKPYNSPNRKKLYASVYQLYMSIACNIFLHFILLFRHSL